MPPAVPPVSLRQQKKQHTFSAIQFHALQLFHEQGYNATSVADIVNKAGISEATFYRYFPTKEDVVLQDNYDPLLLASLVAQPSHLNPAQALRATFRQVLRSFSSLEQQAQRERLQLIATEPKLRARMLDQLSESMRLLAEPLAKRSGRKRDDLAVLTVAGAIMGACMAAMETLRTDPQADFINLLDHALAQLEPGLEL